MRESPAITVILPLRNAAEVIHVGMQGLIDQVDAPPWELVVMDDEDGALTHSFWTDTDLVDRLKQAGCVDFHLEVVNRGISFIHKLGMSAERVSHSSRVVGLWSDDDYFYSDRLWRALDQYDHRKYTCLFDRYGIFVQVATGKALKFDQANYGQPYGLCGCYCAEAWRSLPTEFDGSPDHWLYEKLMGSTPKPLALVMEDDSWQRGVNLNFPRNRGTLRDGAFDKPYGPYTPIDLENVWMPEFIKELVGGAKPSGTGARLRPPT